jgi:hypothetical protein
MRKYVLIINSENEAWCNNVIQFEAMNMIEAKILARKAIEKEKEYVEKKNMVDASEELDFYGSIYEYIDEGRI